MNEARSRKVESLGGVIILVTLEEFVRTLNEDEYVIGDRVWLEGVRFRVAFEVTNIEPILTGHSGRRPQKSRRQTEFEHEVESGWRRLSCRTQP